MLAIALYVFIASAQSTSGIPTELRGSRESLRHMNAVADEYGLERIEDADKLNEFICAGIIVKVTNPDPQSFYLDPESSGVKNYPYLRPWAKEYLEKIATELFKKTAYRSKSLLFCEQCLISDF